MHAFHAAVGKLPENARIHTLTRKAASHEAFLNGGGSLPEFVEADDRVAENTYVMDHVTYDNQNWDEDFTKMPKHFQIIWFVSTILLKYNPRVTGIPRMEILRQMIFGIDDQDCVEIEYLLKQHEKVHAFLKDLGISVYAGGDNNAAATLDANQLVIVPSAQSAHENITTSPCAFCITYAKNVESMIEKQTAKAAAKVESPEHRGAKKRRKRQKGGKKQSSDAEDAAGGGHFDANSASIKLFTTSKQSDALTCHLSGCQSILHLKALMTFVQALLEVAFAMEDASASGWHIETLDIHNINSSIRNWPEKLCMEGVIKDDSRWMNHMLDFFLPLSQTDPHLKCNRQIDDGAQTKRRRSSNRSIDIMQGGGLDAHGLKHLFFNARAPFPHSVSVSVKVYVNSIIISGTMTFLDLAYVYWFITKYMRRYKNTLADGAPS